MFLFGPTKHAKHFEKMAELTYAELTQGRESTRLPHKHRLTSLKNVVISALHKIDKRIHIQAKCNCRGKSMQETEPIMVVWCILNPVTQDNCSASLGKPRDAEQLPS